MNRKASITPLPKRADAPERASSERAARSETQRLRAEVERQSQLARILEDSLEAVADGIVTMDHRGEVVHVSGQLDRDPLVEDDAPILPSSVVNRLRQERPTGTEARVFALEWEGSAAPARYEVRALPISGTNDAVTDGHTGNITLFVFRNRTRERSLEEQLDRSHDLASLGRLAATVAHEIRNPLAAIRGFATLLGEDLTAESPHHLQVERILRGVDRADRIVAELLEYARPVKLRVEPISLESLLAEAVTTLRGSTRWNPKLELDFSIDLGLSPCRGDRRLLLQVLDNLFNNAIDAMQGEGMLTLRVREAEDKRGASGPADSAGAMGSSGRIRIVVRDTGCGMSSDEVARIFEPFYTSKAGGTGLGLALVRRIVEAHEGSVHVVSAPGRGTSFVLDLPTAVVAMGAEEARKETA